MRKRKNDILQGTLALLVLKTLSTQGRMHGYAITGHIQRVSNDLFAGRRRGPFIRLCIAMEEDGWIRASGESRNNGREARFLLADAKGARIATVKKKAGPRLTDGVRRAAFRVAAMGLCRRIV